MLGNWNHQNIPKPQDQTLGGNSNHPILSYPGPSIVRLNYAPLFATLSWISHPKIWYEQFRIYLWSSYIYIYTIFFSCVPYFSSPGYFLGGDLGTILGYAVPCSAVGAVHCRAPEYVDGLLKAPQTGNVWRVRLSAADCLQHSKKNHISHICFH